MSTLPSNDSPDQPSSDSPSPTANHGWAVDQYELVDFGNGRKLERFGSQLLDRPSDAAQHWRPQLSHLWAEANYRLDDKGHCLSRQSALNEWPVRYGAVEFLLRVTPFGHVGLFPEHALTWSWLSQFSSVAELAEGSSPQPKQFLNLFAYTGGATLVMAASGWQVAHVDSSAPTVAWARANAEQSGLATRPIRWLVDDARAFVAREVRRGRTYDAILLDPPAYGHGPKGKAWQIERDLPELLNDCCRLLGPRGVLVLTGHSEAGQSSSTGSSRAQPDYFELPSRLRSAGHVTCEFHFGRTTLRDRSGRALDFGWYLRAIT